MRKVVCEICGTSYNESAANCPICGWENKHMASAKEELNYENETARDASQEAQELDDVALLGAENEKRVFFDFDAVNKGLSSVSEDDTSSDSVTVYEEDDYEEEERRGNPLLVIFLIVLIVALLLGAGFLYFRFLKPASDAKVTEAPTETQQTVATEPEITEESTVPCVSLSLPTGVDVLREPGQYFLLHVIASPEDTTDTLTYASQDESVVTVDENGRLTAIADGETNIVVTCGGISITCPVTVEFAPEETEPETEATEADENENADATEATETEETTAESPEATESTEETKATEATEATESTEATEATEAPSVVLKLKKKDVMIGGRGLYIELELDCDLKPGDVEWITSNSGIANVIDGRVTAMGPGIAKITARYQGQEVSCIVRCNF